MNDVMMLPVDVNSSQKMNGVEENISLAVNEITKMDRKVEAALSGSDASPVLNGDVQAHEEEHEHEPSAEDVPIGEELSQDEETVADLLANDLLEIETSETLNESAEESSHHIETMDVDETSGIFEGASMGTILNVDFGNMQKGAEPETVSSSVESSDGTESAMLTEASEALASESNGLAESSEEDTDLVLSGRDDASGEGSDAVLREDSVTLSAESSDVQESEGNAMISDVSEVKESVSDVTSSEANEVQTDGEACEEVKSTDHLVPKIEKSCSVSPGSSDKVFSSEVAISTSNVEKIVFSEYSSEIHFQDEVKTESDENAPTSLENVSTSMDNDVKTEPIEQGSNEPSEKAVNQVELPVKELKKEGECMEIENQVSRKRSVDERNEGDDQESKKARLDAEEKPQIEKERENAEKEGEDKARTHSVERSWVFFSDDENADDPDPVDSPEGLGELVIDEETHKAQEGTGNAPKEPNEKEIAKVKSAVSLVDSDDEDADDPGSPAPSDSNASNVLKEMALADSDTESAPSGYSSPNHAGEAADKLIQVLRKFRRGSLSQISKYDLEELVNQKICEAITERSPMMGELRRRCQAMEEQCDKWRQIATSCKKQLRDMDSLLQRYLEETKTNKAVIPMRVTRSVGLQVSISPRKPVNSGVSQRPVQAPKSPVRSSPVKSPQPAQASIQSKKIKVLSPNALSQRLQNQPKIRPRPVSNLMPPLIPTRPVVPVAPTMRPSSGEGVIDLTDESPRVIGGNAIVPAPGQRLAFMVPSAKGQPQKYLIATPTSVVRAPSRPFIPPNKHPAPLPTVPMNQPTGVGWGKPPPRPGLKISNTATGIVLSWDMNITSDMAGIKSYQLYAYQEGTDVPHHSLWRQVGDVAALPLPMACTLSCFVPGHRYHFSVRAIDIHGRVGLFSLPGSILLKK